MNEMKQIGVPLALVLCCGLAACTDKAPTTPSTPQNAPAPPARVVSNAPPEIADLRLSAGQVEAGDQIQATGFVSDAETPLDQLTYDWAATPSQGTFTGSGPQLFWRAPAGQKTPDLYTLTLTTTEKYKSNGDIQTNTSSRSATVHYNDSPAEVKQIGSNFLRDFGDFSKTPQQCVSYFSNSCASGKAAELSDITNNRELYHILGSTFTPANLSIDKTRTNATVSGPCTFDDIRNASQAHRHLSGTCVLTAVYENFQWWLCLSNFNDGTINLKASLTH